MKTYKIQIPVQLLSRYRPSNILPIICNKAFVVPNGDGAKEVMIFKTEGVLIMSVDGVVSMGSWEFIADNQSIILSISGESKMYHPIYSDGNAFAFQLDGKQDTLFLFNNSENSMLSNITEEKLYEYFQSKETELIEEAKREEERIEQEKKQKIEEDENKKHEEELQRLEKKKEKRLWLQASKETRVSRSFWKLFIMFVSISLFFSIMVLDLKLENIAPYLFVVFVNIYFLVAMDFDTYLIRRRICINHLHEQNNTQFRKANRLKNLPILIRLCGCLLGFLGCVVAIKSFHWRYYGIIQQIGAIVGLFLAFGFWYLMGDLIAKSIEKKLFGKKLSNPSWNAIH